MLDPKIHNIKVLTFGQKAKYEHCRYFEVFLYHIYFENMFLFKCCYWRKYIVFDVKNFIFMFFNKIKMKSYLVNFFFNRPLKQWIYQELGQ